MTDRSLDFVAPDTTLNSLNMTNVALDQPTDYSQGSIVTPLMANLEPQTIANEGYAELQLSKQFDLSGNVSSALTSSPVLEPQTISREGYTEFRNSGAVPASDGTPMPDNALVVSTIISGANL
jgi:hypothetical protein